jgi:hypothetical protein
MVAVEASTVVAAAAVEVVAAQHTLADTLLQRAVAAELQRAVAAELQRAVVVVALEQATSFAVAVPFEFWLGGRLAFRLPTDWSVSVAAWRRSPLVEPFGLRVVQ